MRSGRSARARGVLAVAVIVVAAVAAAGLWTGPAPGRDRPGPDRPNRSGQDRSGQHPESTPSASGPARRVPPGLAVLATWDRRRAAAWARADPAALARLYVPGSPAGRADVAHLRRYAARGVAVRGLRFQFLAGRVVRRTPRRLVLVVTERLARAVAVRDGSRAELPAGRPARRRITMRRSDGDWLVAEVQSLGQGSRSATALATTSRTSTSANR